MAFGKICREGKSKTCGGQEVFYGSLIDIWEYALCTSRQYAGRAPKGARGCRMPDMQTARLCEVR